MDQKKHLNTPQDEKAHQRAIENTIDALVGPYGKGVLNLSEPRLKDFTGGWKLTEEAIEMYVEAMINYKLGRHA